MKFNTKTIHGGQTHDPAYGAVMPPIYHTSTYAQTTPRGHKGFEYSRTHNPTRHALEKTFASIISPEEWGNKFECLGRFKLDTDYSWKRI